MTGRVVIWCLTGAEAARLRAFLPAPWQVDTISGEHDVHRAASAACVVVAVPRGRLSDAKCVKFLEALHALPERVPLLIAGNPTHEVIRLASRHAPSDIIWESELEARLPSAVAALRVSREFKRTSDLLNEEIAVGRAVRSACAELADSRRRVYHVGELAHLCGYHRSTLAREWQAARVVGVRLPETIEDYVDWGLVLSTAALARRDRKWSWVSGELGVPLQRIARQCARLAQLRLSDLNSRNGTAAFERFDERVVEPMHLSMQATKRQRKLPNE